MSCSAVCCSSKTTKEGVKDPGLPFHTMNMMSDFDYALDVDEEYQGHFQEDEFEWENSGPAPGPMYNSRRSNSGYMNAQYSEAFGDYRGGYGPGGGFGPPRPRPYPRGRGFGPIGPPQRRGPPVHRAALFLSKCEVAQQYIKPLPWQLLDMIEPDYCGLCGQGFESFAVAKIHYNCKNHYKAQKKFMALNKSTKNKNEILPMKARNLYCELCDVHITSTSHADSHYAGKSHRAIVEVRKPPKNPILLRQGMQGRVDQLIRREKKNLKAAPEAEKEQIAVEKNVPPELICEICKTSVTCSEQMTNHLNGKKHLTKEKQHILNMMKGKANKNDADKGKEENVVDVKEEENSNDEDIADVPEEDVMEENPAVSAAEEPVEEWGAGGGAEWDTQHTPQAEPGITG